MKTENQDRLLRLPDVLFRIPVSKSTWWSGIKTGRFPQPVKLGPRTTAWKESDVEKIIQGESPGGDREG